MKLSKTSLALLAMLSKEDRKLLEAIRGEAESR
jgi:hypothetical protein